MTPARELLKSGRVSEAKYEPPLLSGYVREGAKNYRSGLRIKSAIDVENICSCWESRSAGKICAHSVAVGLSYLNPPAAVVAAPNEATMPEPPAGPGGAPCSARYLWRGDSSDGRGGRAASGASGRVARRGEHGDEMQLSAECSGSLERVRGVAAAEQRVRPLRGGVTSRFDAPD